MSFQIPSFPSGSPISQAYMQQQQQTYYYPTDPQQSYIPQQHVQQHAQQQHMQPQHLQQQHMPQHVQQQQHAPQHMQHSMDLNTEQSSSAVLYQMAQHTYPTAQPFPAIPPVHSAMPLPTTSSTSTLPAQRNRSKQVYDSSTLLPDGATADKSKQQKSPKQSYNRKEKSLSLLCDRFLSQFNREPILNDNGDIDEHNHLNQINLDNRAAELGVERRRVYDIVNILESVNMVGKRGKNLYIWYGTKYLASSLQKLHDEIDTVTIVEGVKLSEIAHVLLPHNIEKLMQNQSFSALTKNVFDDIPSAVPGSRQPKSFGHTNHTSKEHSLGTLSQLFVQLFFSTPLRILSLEDAAIAIMEAIKLQYTRQHTLDRESAQSSFKSKVRRLYDIANVLASAKLIEKVHVVNTRKSAYRWYGAGAFALDSQVDASYAVVDDSSTPNVKLDSTSVKKQKLSPSSSSAAVADSTAAPDIDPALKVEKAPELPALPDMRMTAHVQYTTPPKLRLASTPQPNNLVVQHDQDVASSKEQIPVRTAYYPSDVPQIQSEHIQHTIDTLKHLSTSGAARTDSKAPAPCKIAEDFNLYRHTGNTLSSHSLLTQFNNACRVWLSTADDTIHEIKMGRL